jgi:tRNA (guanine37-N1)-methyltransferase
MRWIDSEISIGDYVLTGGELPAMVLADSVCRMVPGVVKEWESVEKDSFFDSVLDYSQYTRPKDFLGMKVPRVLVSGNHREIESWRARDSMRNTLRKRPDLVKNSFAPDFSRR